MALQAERDVELRLPTWEDVQDYAARKDVCVRWLPCTRGMRVADDRFIETEDRERIYVSARGWTALCRSLDCDPGTLQRIESQGIATQVLNDAWDRKEESMMRRRIVVDAWTVVGVVGSRRDVSWVGVEARNGLSGECSVAIRATVVRLVCANGMVRTAADYNQRIGHTGGQDMLDREVRRILGTANDGLDRTVKWLTKLGRCGFDAKAIADNRESVRLVRKILSDLDAGAIGTENWCGDGTETACRRHSTTWQEGWPALYRGRIGVRHAAITPRAGTS